MAKRTQRQARRVFEVTTTYVPPTTPVNDHSEYMKYTHLSKHPVPNAEPVHQHERQVRVIEARDIYPVFTGE